MNPIHWHILGAGAIGGLWAYYLDKAERPISLLLRATAARRYEGLRLEGLGNSAADIRAIPSEVLVDAAAPNPNSNQAQADEETLAKIEYLLVCCKSHQSLAALKLAAARLSDNTTVVLLQNGLGVMEALLAEIPAAKHWQILHASTTEGAFRHGRFTIQHAGRGDTVIGDLRGQCDKATLRRIAQSLSAPPLHVEVSDNIQGILWRKLAVNCAINPLTAIYRCYNGDLASRCPEEVDAVVAEITALSQAMGLEAETEGLRDLVYQVIERTAANRSSMLQDVSAGRPSEIDYINGHICRLADTHGLACPENQRLWHIVRQLTS